jgi:hypothetical protein
MTVSLVIKCKFTHKLTRNMNAKAKFLFFCMIFVGTGVFAQKNVINNITEKSGIAFYRLDKPHFYNFYLVKKQNKFYSGFPAFKTINENKPIISATPIISSNFYTQNFGFFCKKELQLEKITKIPFKFRLGSVQQCDWMEGKRVTLR